jgi:hypothetical protein
MKEVYAAAGVTVKVASTLQRKPSNRNVSNLLSKH